MQTIAETKPRNYYKFFLKSYLKLKEDAFYCIDLGFEMQQV